MSANGFSIKLVVGLVLLAVAGWALYSSIEFYEDTEHSRWSLAALRNPYLAAREFITRSGIEVTDVDSLARLDELTNVGTLFFSDPNQVRTPRQLRQVMDWLEVGGNVIYTANAISHDDDLLLAEFDVEVDWRDYETGRDSDDKPLSKTMREYNRQIEKGKSREEVARSFSGPETSITTIGFDDDIGQIEAAFDNDKILLHPHIDSEKDSGEHLPFSWSRSDHGVHLMQFEVGSGLLTIVSDPQVWSSYQIDRQDHAYLLWLLSSGEGDFAILRSVLRDSIWVLMRRNATELLIAAGLLALIWIWRAGYRFGRLLPYDQSRRRALGEHFTSISHYLWHRRDGAFLVNPLRQRILSRASLVLGEFSHAGRERQYQLLARRCGIEATAIARAFDHDEFNEATFVQTVRLLKRIEQSL